MLGLLNASILIMGKLLTVPKSFLVGWFRAASTSANAKCKYECAKLHIQQMGVETEANTFPPCSLDIVMFLVGTQGSSALAPVTRGGELGMHPGQWGVSRDARNRA